MEHHTQRQSPFMTEGMKNIITTVLAGIILVAISWVAASINETNANVIETSGISKNLANVVDEMKEELYTKTEALKDQQYWELRFTVVEQSVNRLQDSQERLEQIQLKLHRQNQALQATENINPP